jgi:hypothetical protein
MGDRKRNNLIEATSKVRMVVDNITSALLSAISLKAEMKSGCAAVTTVNRFIPAARAADSMFFLVACAAVSACINIAKTVTPGSASRTTSIRLGPERVLVEGDARDVRSGTAECFN